MFIKKDLLLFIPFGIIFFLLFYKLGSTYLTNWDEAWYADIARNMLHSGNFLTPVWDHHPFFDKPPLYFWLETLAFKVFGVTEFAARFFSAVSALGVCVVTYLIGRLLFGKRAAVISLLVVASSIGFLYRSRTGNLDAMLTFWIFLAIYGFYRGFHKKKDHWYVLKGMALGMVFLTKGMVVIIFPSLILLYLIFTRDFSTLKNRYLWLGFLLGAAISLAWFLVSLAINGDQFWWSFFYNQTGKVSNSIYFWRSFSLDYIGYLKSGLKLWFIFLVPAFLYSVLVWKKTTAILLTAFFIVYFLILSFSENKSNWFLMPLYPIVALMIGGLLTSFRWTEKKRWKVGVLGLVVAISLFQVIRFHSEFIVPETETDEVKVALAAKQMTNPGDILYLTGLSYPTIIYYSERESYATFGGQSTTDTFWVLPGNSWPQILQKDPVYIVTTDNEMSDNKYLKNYQFQTLFQAGDRKLIKRI